MRHDQPGTAISSSVLLPVSFGQYGNYFLSLQPIAIFTGAILNVNKILQNRSSPGVPSSFFFKLRFVSFLSYVFFFKVRNIIQLGTCGP